MTIQSGRLDPYSVYHLTKATYQKNKEGFEAYLSEHFEKGEVTLLDTATVGTWKTDLYQKGEHLIVVTRGTANIASVVVDVANEVFDGPLFLKKQEETVEEWEKKFNKKVTYMVGHSAGGFYATHCLKDRTDIERVTFNGQKVLQGSNTTNLCLSGDFLSAMDNPENYIIVGNGGHGLHNFNDICQKGVSWEDIEVSSPSVLRKVIGSAVAEVKEVVKDELTEMGIAFLTKKSRELAKKHPIKSMMLNVSAELLQRGYDEGMDVLKDPAFIQDVLTSSCIDYAFDRLGKKDNPTLEKLKEFAKDLIANIRNKPLKDLLPELADKVLKKEQKDAEELLKGCEGLYEELKEFNENPEAKKKYEAHLKKFSHALTAHTREAWEAERRERAFVKEGSEQERIAKSAREERELKSCVSPFNPDQVQGFLISHLDVCTSVFTAQTFAANLIEEINETRQRLGELRERKSGIKEREGNLKELDKRLHEHYQKKIKKQAKLHLWMERILLGACAAADCVSPGTGEATYKAAHSYMKDIIQGSESSTLNMYQSRAQTSSRTLDINAGRLSRNTARSESAYNHLASSYQRLENNRRLIDPETYSEQLKKAREDLKKRREEVEKQKSETQKTRDNAQGEVDKLKGKKKSKPDHKERIREGEEIVDFCNDEEKEIDQELKNIDKDEKEIEDRIKWDEAYLKDMRMAVWPAIQRNVSWFTGYTEEDKQVRRGLQENYADYQQARDLCRNPALQGLQAAGTLANQIGVLTGTDQLGAGVETFTTLYKLYDMGLYWGEYAIPELMALGKKEHGTELILKAILSPIGIAQYIVPFLGTVSLGISAIQGIYHLLSGKKQLTKEQMLLQEIQKSLAVLGKQMSQLFDRYFINLHLDLDRKHQEVIEKFRSQQTMLCNQTALLLSTITEGFGKVHEKIDDTAYKAYILNLENHINESQKQLKTKFSKCLTSIDCSQEFKKKLSALLSGYKIQLESCVNEANNNVNQTYDGGIESFHAHQLMPKNPQHFTGYLGRIQGKTLPNAAMWLKLSNLFVEQLSELMSHKLEHDEVNAILEVAKLIYGQGADLKLLNTHLEGMVDSALSEYSKICKPSLKKIESQEMKREKNAKQLTSSLWKPSSLRQYIGAEKFNLNFFIHHERLLHYYPELNSLQNWAIAEETILFSAPIFTIPLALALEGYRGSKALCAPISNAECYRKSEIGIMKSLSSLTRAVNDVYLNTPQEVKERFRKGNTNMMDLHTLKFLFKYVPKWKQFSCEFDPYITDSSDKFRGWVIKDDAFKNSHVLNLAVTVDLWAQTIFSNVEAGQLTKKDIQSIQPANISPQGKEKYNHSTEKLMNDYSNFLSRQLGTCSEPLPESNSFKHLVESSIIIPSIANSQLPPLAFPKTAIEMLYLKMEPYATEMMVGEDNHLWPAYSFERTSTGQMMLKIDFHCKNGKFQSHTLALFDEVTYYGFGKTYIDESKQEFKQREPVAEEFLLQMMYTDVVDGLGMPGKGTYQVTAGNGHPLVAPVEQPFSGLWKLLNAFPLSCLDYRYIENTGDKDAWISMMRNPSDPENGEGYFKSLEKKEKLNAEMEKNLSSYKEKYYELLTLCEWLTGQPIETLKTAMQRFLSLPDPKLSGIHHYLQPLQEKDFSSELFQNFINLYSGKQREEVERIIEKLKG